MSAPPLRPLIWTTARPCVRCGGSDRCSISTTGRTAICRTVRAWQPTDRVKTDRGGEEYAVISLGAPDPADPADPSASEPEPPADEWRLPIADPHTRDRVYLAVARACPLLADDLKGLLQRGLTIEECRTLGYWSHPTDPQKRSDVVFQIERSGEKPRKHSLSDRHPADFSRDELVATPGIYRVDRAPELVLSGPGGLGIPVRDWSGRIVGARVRHVQADGPDAGKKRIVWLSSPARPDVLGAGCKALPHVPLLDLLPADVREAAANAFSGLDSSRLTVRITEGEIKADITTLRTGVLTLSIPGVGQWSSVLPILDALTPARVLLAFDGDARTNPAVAGALQRLAAAVVARPYHPALAVETWPEAHKGIDDAIHAGATITTHEGADAIARISSLVSTSGARVDDEAAETLSASPALAAARAIIAALPDRARKDGAARAALATETLSAALTLQKHDPAEYAQLKITLKTLKVPAADWKAAMERAHAATQAQSRLMRGTAGVASATPPGPPQGPPGLPSELADDPDAQDNADSPPQPFERGDADELARTLLDDMRRASASTEPVVYDRGIYWSFAASGLWTPSPVDPHNIVSGYAGREVDDERGKGTKPLRLSNGAIEGAVKNASRLAARPDFFAISAGAPAGIMFRNGILVVRKTGEVQNGREVQRIVLERPTPEHRAIHMIDVDFDAEAPAPRWNAALRAMFTPPVAADEIPTDPDALEVFERDRAQDTEDCIQLLHAFIGLSLLGKATEYARCLVLLGDGSNGKSTVIDVMSALAPRSAIAAVPPHQWANHFHLAALLNKRLNLVNELPAKDLMEADVFKAVVAGNMTTVAFKHKDAFDFYARAGHVFAANALPGTTDQTEGFWRRFMVLCFDRKFRGKEIIYNLAEQIIREEIDGVAARCITAAQQVLDEGGFKLPASSAAMIDEWKERSDQVRQFVKARCRVVERGADGSRASALYPSYVAWAGQNGYARLSVGKFSERLGTLGYRHKLNSCWVYKLALIPDAELLPDDAGSLAERFGSGTAGGTGWAARGGAA